MQIGMRRVSPETLEWFGTACREGGVTRAALAREVCERETWRNRLGKPCLASARKVLPRLAERTGVRLPQALPMAHSPAVVSVSEFPDRSLVCTLGALGALSLERVADVADRRRWEAMIRTHHPEGWHRSPGSQLQYWVHSVRYGVLGGISFAAAGMQLGPRDGAVGWSPDARIANIGLVVSNNRFLLLPGVRVKRLASCTLRLAAERIADDWEAAHGVRPVLAQTFTSPGQSGLSYQAAGWTCCPGLTSGRRSGVRRAVWLKPLALGWRERLCQEPERPLGWSDPLPCEGDWAAREYGRSPHTDGRVRRRLVEMGVAWQDHLGQSLPEIFPGRAEQQAAYRLLSNPGVGVEHILASHFEATVERCRAERLILAIQDTTTLNHDGLVATEGLDTLGGAGKGANGILAHVGMTVNAAGRPLGMISLDATFRQADGKDSIRWLDGVTQAEQLAAACPDSKVVSVCDREGDFWELLSHAHATSAALLVRANKAAQRRVIGDDGQAEDLWSYVGKAEPVGERRIEVPACGGPKRRLGRSTRLVLRCLTVELIPPKMIGGTPLRMIAVSAKEEDPPASDKVKPLDWLLLTTEGQADFETACTTLHWYELRWQIERFFYALKVGTRIEDRRLDAADDLRKCLAFDAITAFRVWDLTWLARDRPDEPAADYVQQDEITVLFAVAKRLNVRVPRGPPEPDIKTFVILTAGLAGFRPTKRQPMPGTKKLWQGLMTLSPAVLGYQAMRDNQ